MRKRMAAVLLLLGLLLGPAQYLHARFFSGKVVATHALIVAPNGQHFDQLPIALDPGMGNIGLVLRFSVSHGPTPVPPDTPRNDFRVRVVDGERVLLDHAFSLQSSDVESTPSRQFQRALPVLQISYPGIYRLELAAEGEPGMRLHSADVVVRAHVREPDRQLLLVGGALAVAGFVALLF